MVTHQLQVKCRSGKVRRSETDVLPLSHTTNKANFVFHNNNNNKQVYSHGHRFVFNIGGRRTEPLKLVKILYAKPYILGNICAIIGNPQT